MSSNIVSLDTRLLKEIRDNVGVNQQVKVMGLSTDGTQEQIGTDNNNNVKCNIVSAVSVLPHNSSNGELSPTNSFNVKVNNTNNLNVKLEDVTSSLDGEHTNHSRSLGVILKGRKIISDNTSSEYLKVSENGLLNVKTEKERVVVDVLLSSSGSALGGSITASGITESVDLREFRSYSVYISNVSGGNALLEVSDDNITFYEYEDFFSVSLSTGQNIIFSPPRVMEFNYIRIKNSGLSSMTFGKILVHKLNL